MAGPFDVQVPAWLERIARPIDAEQTGALIGQGLAAVATAFQENTPADEEMGFGKAGESKGFKQGLLESRMNLADPMWKQKFQMALEAQRINQNAKWMQMQEDAGRLRVMDETVKAKQQIQRDEADDAAAYAQAKAEVGGDALKLVNHGMPPFKSNKYRMMWQTDVNTAKAADSVIDRNNAAMALRQQQVKDAAEFDKALSALTVPADRLAIQQEKDPQVKLQMLAAAQERDQAKAEAEAAASGLEVTTTRTGPRGTIITRGIPKKTSTQAAQDYYDTLVAEGAEPEAIAMAKAALERTAKGAARGDDLYNKPVEIINVGGHQFIKWGRQLRSVDDPKNKAELGILTSKITHLQTELIKNPEDDKHAAADNSLTQQLLSARKELRKHFENTKAPPQEAAQAPEPKKTPFTYKIVKVGSGVDTNEPPPER